MLSFSSQISLEDRIILDIWSQFGGFSRRWHYCSSNSHVLLSSLFEELVHLVLSLKNGHLEILALFDLSLLLSFLDIGLLLTFHSFSTSCCDGFGRLGVIVSTTIFRLVYNHWRFKKIVITFTDSIFFLNFFMWLLFFYSVDTSSLDETESLPELFLVLFW